MYMSVELGIICIAMKIYAIRPLSSQSLLVSSVVIYFALQKLGYNRVTMF